MRRQKIALMVSMLCRIGIGVASILVLAHGLDPVDYGFVVTVLAWSAIAALATDFGFGVQALRDVGAAPDRAGEVMARCLGGKILLATVTSLAIFIFLFFLALPLPLVFASLMLCGSVMVTSFADLFAVALRGIGRYDTETKGTIVGGIFFVVLIALAALFSPNLLSLSAAILIARIGLMILQYVLMRRYIRLEPIFGVSIREMWQFMRKSLPLALDTILTVLIQQVDVILVSSFLGLEAAATYQVISRTAMYFLLPTQILAGVYMPRLAAEYRSDAIALIKSERRMQREFVVVGAAIATCFLITPYVISYALPPQFMVSQGVSISLAVFIFLHYLASSFGCSLIIRHRTDFRLIGQLSGFFALFCVMPLAVLGLGLIAAPLALVISSFVTLSIYVFFWSKARSFFEST